MKSKHRFGTLPILLGCCCLVVAAALYGYNGWVSARAAKASDKLTGKLSSLLQDTGRAGSADGVDPLLGNPDSTGSSATSSSLNVNGHETIGIISLPTIDITLAVLSTWSYPNLNVSACRYSGTPDGKMVLLAHDYDRHFGRIHELKPGDSVQFTSTDGRVYRYQVTGTEIRGKYELSEILSGDWDLTLFTCTYGGENRVVVRCKRVAGG